MGGTRDLAKLVFWDPDHVSERLTLKFIERLGEPSLLWATGVEGRPDVDLSAVATDLRRRSVHVARVYGAVAGTPFLIALVPGRAWIRSGLLVLSLAIPIVFVALADHNRAKTGVSGVGAAGAIVALSLVISASLVARRA